MVSNSLLLIFFLVGLLCLLFSVQVIASRHREQYGSVSNICLIGGI